VTDRDEQMLTLKDVAHLLQVSPRTVRRMVESGEFPKAVPVGRGERWTLGEVRQWQLRRRLMVDAGLSGTPAPDRSGQSGTTKK
jgi:excisionase family DNA binding protein